MSQTNIRRTLSVLFILVVLVLGLVPPIQSNAADKTGGNGLRVSPVRTDLTVYPGKTEKVTINVTNVTNVPAVLQTIINDFVANPNESGEPAIIFDTKQFAPNHSLKRFASTSGNFSLGAGESKNVVININIPANAAGGGYYGAVRFAPAANENAANENVALAGSVGSLILVKVPGDVNEKLSIASFDARVNDRPSTFFLNNNDIDAVVRFQNEGNIQEQPFGKILLKNRSGKILATYEVNNTNPPGNVLPDSIRKFTIPLKDKVGSFGQFKLESNYGYGSGGQLLSASTTFYVIPLWLIIAFIAVVGLIVFIVFGVPRLIKAYNRRVLRKAGRRQ